MHTTCTYTCVMYTCTLWDASDVGWFYKIVPMIHSDVLLIQMWFFFLFSITVYSNFIIVNLSLLFLILHPFNPYRIKFVIFAGSPTNGGDTHWTKWPSSMPPRESTEEQSMQSGAKPLITFIHFPVRQKLGIHISRCGDRIVSASKSNATITPVWQVVVRPYGCIDFSICPGCLMEPAFVIPESLGRYSVIILRPALLSNQILRTGSACDAMSERNACWMKSGWCIGSLHARLGLQNNYSSIIYLYNQQVGTLILFFLHCR